MVAIYRSAPGRLMRLDPFPGAERDEAIGCKGVCGLPCLLVIFRRKELQEFRSIFRKHGMRAGGPALRSSGRMPSADPAFIGVPSGQQSHMIFIAGAIDLLRRLGQEVAVNVRPEPE